MELIGRGGIGSVYRAERVDAEFEKFVAIKLVDGSFHSADQFSDDILRYLEGRPVQARGEAPRYVAAKFIRRNRVVVAVAGLLRCSLVGGLIEVSLALA